MIVGVAGVELASSIWRRKTEVSVNLCQSALPGTRLPNARDEDQCSNDKARPLLIRVGPQLWTTLSGFEFLPPSQPSLTHAARELRLGR